MTDYEQGFNDGVLRAAQQICMRCQQGWKVENREALGHLPVGKVIPHHQDPDGIWRPCGAADIRALVPGQSWREGQFLLTPEFMAASFHEAHGRLAPKFGYKIRDDIYSAQTQVNRYRAALQHIATHSKDRNTVDDAILALLEGEHLPLWDPRPWDQACEVNRGLTIAVCAEILAKVGSKTND